MDFRKGSISDIGKVLETLSDNDLEMLGGEPEQNLRDDDICVVCEDDGKPVGYIVGFDRTNDENKWYSVELAVNPQYRGKGLGYELGRRLVSCVRKTEASLICWRVEKPNESSKRIVEKLGGKLQGFDGRYLKYYIFNARVDEGTVEEANEESVVNEMVAGWFRRNGFI